MTVLGMVGCGSWGANWVRTLASMPDVDLRWCCDLSPTLLAKMGQQYPQIQTTSDFNDLISDPEVEGIVMATIAPTHYDLAKRAIEAGKHVMVEKPMTLSTGDAENLARLARNRRRVLMVGHLLEYHPAVLYIKQMIDAGELGEVYYLYSQRLNLGKVRTDENAWWSLAPHDVSVALRLLGGTPTAVQCRGQNVVQPNVADVVFGTLEFPGGKLAHIHVSWLDPHKTRKLTVVGSKRMVVFDDTLPGYKVTVHDKGFQLRDRTESFAEWVTLTQGDMVLPKIDATEPLVREAKHFVDCVRKNAKPISDGESGAQVVAVLEYGQMSLETNQVVKIPRLNLGLTPDRAAA